MKDKSEKHKHYIFRSIPPEKESNVIRNFCICGQLISIDKIKDKREEDREKLKQSIAKIIADVRNSREIYAYDLAEKIMKEIERSNG